MIGGGQLAKTLITIQRNTPTQNALNENVDSWATLVELRARRSDASEGEKTAAGQQGAFLASNFVVRRSDVTDGILPRDRLVEGGDNWNIVGIKRLRDDPDRFLEILAVKDVE